MLPMVCTWLGVALTCHSAATTQDMLFSPSKPKERTPKLVWAGWGGNSAALILGTQSLLAPQGAPSPLHPSLAPQNLSECWCCRRALCYGDISQNLQPQTPGSSPAPGQEPAESEAPGMPLIPTRAGGDNSSAQQVQQLQRWRGRKSWRPLQRHAGSVGMEQEPAGSQRLQGGLLLPNPAAGRQGKQLRECLMAEASASAAFTAPILQHLCWLAGARE